MKRHLAIAFICTLFCLNLVFLVGFVYAEIRINEVELNPEGTDSGNEWIELYSSNNVEMTNWEIKNKDLESYLFNASFLGYYKLIIEKSGILTNDNQIISLYNGTNKISFTTNLSDSENNNKTWQYCSGEWLFRQGTPGAENNCTAASTSQNNQTNQTTNTNNTTNTNTNTPDEIRIELDWQDEDILAGEEFELEVSVFNLENYDYDLKIWIEEDGQTISERYDENSEEWKSGYYYLEEFFEGTGDKKKEVLIRLDEDNKDFNGDTRIYVKLRKGSTNILDYDKKIEILEPKETNVEINSFEGTSSSTLGPITGEVIKLSSQSEKSTTVSAKAENSIIYKSKNEYIKEYIGYAFAFVCVIIIILLLIKGV